MMDIHEKRKPYKPGTWNHSTLAGSDMIRIPFALICLIVMNNVLAQNPASWSFGKFKRETDKQIALPHFASDELWLFEQAGNWGLYSKAEKSQWVPPKYDLVLPTLKRGILYVIKNGKVGLYAMKGGELIEANEFETLQVEFSEDDLIYVNNNHDFDDGYKDNDEVTYLLKMSTEGSWSAKRLEHNPRNDRIDPITYNEDGKEIWGRWPEEAENKPGGPQSIDKISWLRDDLWVHHHSLLKYSEDYSLSEIVEKSGIISNDSKEYLIDPGYFSITEKYNFSNSYFEVGRTKDLDTNDDLDDTMLTGLFSDDFRLIIEPLDGSVGGVDGGGYFASDNTILEIYDQTGNRICDIKEFNKQIEFIYAFNNSYYVATETDDPGKTESYIYDYAIYDASGAYIDQQTFSIEEIAYDTALMIVSVQVSDDSYELLEAVFNLSSNDYLKPPEYDDIQIVHIRNTLLDNLEGDCDYYLVADKNDFFGEPKDSSSDLDDLSFGEDDLFTDSYEFWNCQGESIELEHTSVSAKGMYVTDDSGQDFQSEAIPVTHVLTDEFYELSRGESVTYPGHIEEEYNGFVIYKVLEYIDSFFTPDEPEIYYALGYENDGPLILDPSFTTMKFDRENDQIQMTYNDQEYTFPLSRYER